MILVPTVNTKNCFGSIFICVQRVHKWLLLGKQTLLFDVFIEFANDSLVQKEDEKKVFLLSWHSCLEPVSMETLFSPFCSKYLLYVLLANLECLDYLHSFGCWSAKDMFVLEEIIRLQLFNCKKHLHKFSKFLIALFVKMQKKSAPAQKPLWLTFFCKYAISISNFWCGLKSNIFALTRLGCHIYCLWWSGDVTISSHF